MKALLSLVVPALWLGLVTSARAADPHPPTVLAQNTPEVCTEIYQPVCGTDRNGKRNTYSNACFARAARATDVKPGECPK
jgi:hypothetical protein